jgi:hypothetical protein
MKSLQSVALLQADCSVPSLQSHWYRSPIVLHVPFWQLWPLGQLPVWQVPPQPSSAPQTASAHSGVQPQAPGLPPPPQVSGAMHVTHATPPTPHWASVAGETQTPLAQQPSEHLAPAQGFLGLPLPRCLSLPLCL